MFNAFPPLMIPPSMEDGPYRYFLLFKRDGSFSGQNQCFKLKLKVLSATVNFVRRKLHKYLSLNKYFLGRNVTFWIIVECISACNAFLQQVKIEGHRHTTYVLRKKNIDRIFCTWERIFSVETEWIYILKILHNIILECIR